MKKNLTLFSSVAFLCLASASAQAAAQLIWDPLLNNGVTSSSGNWDTTGGNAVWYNGASDVVWSQTGTTSPSQGATFNGPDAAPGTYIVTLDAGQIAVTNLTINNSGYVFAGANAIYLGTSDILSVAAGKTVTFNCGLQGSGTAPVWSLGSGATMNVTGNISSSQQVRVTGAPDSAYNFSGVNNPAIMAILAPVNLTSGSLIPSSSFYIGYIIASPINGVAYTAGSLTISGSSTVFTVNGNILIIGRSGGAGKLVLNDGTATVGNLTANRNLAINYDGATSGSLISSGTVLMNGGTLNVGGSSMLGNRIAFFQTAATAGATALLNQTGGTINTWGGVIFGFNSAGSFSGASATWMQSGGAIYIGSSGISAGPNYTAANNDTESITLSGGTVGALASWSSALPITLGTTNGNITFQCSDAGSNPFNISLSGALIGAGGLNVAGGGTLTLSGANNYADTTVVSNGTLAVLTTSSPTNGAVTVDGGAGTPTLTVQSNPGQHWANNGALTFQNGTPTLSFQFGLLAPSATVAPVQVNGNVAFAATPLVNVGGAAIALGTYPLIKYTGAVSGSMPTSVNAWTGGTASAGYITNITATKTIALVVTASSYNPALYWGVGNGVWDINTTANWKQFGNPIKYTDGNAVIFDDSASGSSPITVTLNSVVNPLSVTANNTAKNYVIAGSGSITGAGSLSLLGGGTVTLAGTNTYSGGTTISAGQLNINNGGNATDGTAIGTGPLTINAGATLDNTSGADITLQTNITENWNGSFTYLGSSNSFNTGSGQVNMNGNTAISVSSNTFVVGGSITDNGNNFQLSKTGNGTLTLPVGNSFGGGMSLSSGRLNLGDPSAAGFGVFTISGGAIDNSSGADLTLSPSSYFWAGSFSFLGTTNLDLGSLTVTVPNGLGSITVNMVSNILTTHGTIVNNNTTVVKTGGGTWEMTGSGGGSQSLGLVVSGGQVNLHMSGQAITGGNNVGLTVQAGGVVLDESSFQIHSDSPIPLPVTLSGGVWDLNGFNENVDKLFISNGGTLRNGSGASSSTLNTISGYTAMLSGTNCHIDVPAADGVLNFKGVFGGSGSLVKTGPGVLNLESNNIYTGDTIIAGGTLALLGPSSVSNTANIVLATSESALDMSGNTDTNGNPTPLLELLNGQTLSGFGAVTGLVQTIVGATVAPGSASAVGVLSVIGPAGTNILNGTALMKLDKGNHTNDQLLVSGALVYGGTLALENLSGTLAPGDTFTLFSAAGGLSGSFASISPPRPGFPGFGLAWNTNNLAINGTVSILSAPIPPPPVISGVHLSGTTLTIQATNGPANEPFVLLESTNVAAALHTWAPVLTNAFDSNGHFSVPITVTTNTPEEFFRVQLQ
jgi:autotransporter-associated beta strand protein